MCKEMFFMRWYRIDTRFQLIHKFGYQNGNWEGKNSIGTSLLVSLCYCLLSHCVMAGLTVSVTKGKN